MDLGDRIRVLRAKNGLSQGDLAKALGSATSTISEVERGERAPRLELLIKMADFFGVSTDYLLSREVEGDWTNLAERIGEVESEMEGLRRIYEEKTAELQERIKRFDGLRPPGDIPVEIIGEIPERIDGDTRARLEEEFGMKLRGSSLHEEYQNAFFWFLVLVKRLEEEGWRLRESGEGGEEG